MININHQLTVLYRNQKEISVLSSGHVRQSNNFSVRNRNKQRAVRLIGCFLLAVLFIAGGCDKFKKNDPKQTPVPASASAKPIEANMINPVKRQVTDYEEFTGRLMPFDEVDVRAQVDGTLMECTFKEGGKMKISPQTGEPVSQEIIPPSASGPSEGSMNPVLSNNTAAPSIAAGDKTNAGNRTPNIAGQSGVGKTKLKTTAENTVTAAADFSPQNSAGISFNSGSFLKFHEGSEVKEGDLLFVINPELYEAELAAAQGDLKVLEARKKRLESEFKRSEELLPSSAVSKQDYDLALANLQECDGEIAVVRAKILKAQINVNYTKIYAPIDGYVCNSKVSIGNLIQSNSTSLVRIVKIDPIFLYFYIDETTVLRLKEIADARKNANPGSVIEPVIEFRLSDEPEFNHQAKIDYMTPAMDQATGTRLVRAVCQNPKSVSGERLFHPGMTVHLRICVTEKYDALLVPEKSLGMNQSTHFVYVLGKNGKPEMQTVELGPMQTDNWRVIRKGLSANDTVIIDNLMRLRPDRPVVRANSDKKQDGKKQNDKKTDGEQTAIK